MTPSAILCLLYLVALTSSTDPQQTRFDYVVVGGGTAGLVVASRLSENPEVTVGVIEAGDFEQHNPNVTSTTALGIAKNTDIDWQYESVPQAFVANKSLIWSAGKGLGGSSLINGMTYMRPTSDQINLWPSLGLELDWKRLFAYSKKGESFQPPSSNITALGACYETNDHGFSGPLATCISKHMTPGDLHELLNSTFLKLGIPPRCEFDGGELHGFGVQMVTQDSIADIREDAARAYYYPVENRENLVVMVSTTATRLLWSDNATAVATGVEIVRDGHTSVIYADREVVLSAGAIRTPAILEYSGVGNPNILSRYSIDVKVALSAVGENMQDQTTIAVVASALQNFTGFPAFVAHTSLHDLFGTNTTSIYEKTLAKLPAYASTIAADSGGNATVQEYLLKTQLDLLINSNTPASEIAPLGIQTLIGGVFWPLQPFSRGSIHIKDANRTVPPAINARFLEIDFDGEVAVATARFTRKLLMTEPLSNVVNVSTISPSLTLVPEDAPDQVWLDWIKTNGSLAPNYHHLGTCAMLPKDMGGVVDNDFKVYGTRNVRVVDLSIVPLQVAGHSTALLYGIAEWAAEKLCNSTKSTHNYSR